MPVKEKRIDQRASTERRAVVRYPCNRPAFCAPTLRQERLGATVQDISGTGIALLVERELPPETPIGIFFWSATQLPFQLPARVVHCTRQPDGWLLGCAFNTQLSSGELMDLV